jgi:hypothetical protein
MTRLEQRGAVAFTCMGVAVMVILLITWFGHQLFDHRNSLAFRRTSSSSLQRKLAVSAIVRPWAISFVRSLMSISDQGSPEFASMGAS